MSTLASVAKDCATPGWDGYGADGVHPESLERAVRFLALLEALPAPEVSCDPDGCVALDWFGEKPAILSLSFTAIGYLAFAWHSHDARGYGTMLFDGHSLPAGFEALLARVIG